MVAQDYNTRTAAFAAADAGTRDLRATAAARVGCARCGCDCPIFSARTAAALAAGRFGCAGSACAAGTGIQRAGGFMKLACGCTLTDTDRSAGLIAVATVGCAVCIRRARGGTTRPAAAARGTHAGKPASRADANGGGRAALPGGNRARSNDDAVFRSTDNGDGS